MNKIEKFEIIATLLTDWYKIGHPYQYHPNTSLVYSNLTARGSRINEINYVVNFGISAFVQEYLIDNFRDNFFNLPIEYVVEKFKNRIRKSLGGDLPPIKHEFYQKNYPGDPYGHVRHLHSIGYLPLIIKALPEGTKVPLRVPFVTIRNEHHYPELFWLTNSIETLMSTSTWQMLTSATLSNRFREVLTNYALLTVGDASFVKYQGHDFSFRGMSSVQSALYSGAGHLVNFNGTDTIPAIEFIEHYYNANNDPKVPLIGVSVPATEHAVMCSNTGFYVYDMFNKDWDYIGKAEQEVFKYIITELYPNGLVSIVSDTFNLWKVLTEFLPNLKQEILNRDGKVVIRPDSGDPVDILCGLNTSPKFKDNQITELLFPNHYPEYYGVVELLDIYFGHTISTKGYRFLNEKVGVIYGDGINIERAINICERLMSKQYASINWVAGIGSYTYQYNTRDTFGLAVKATYCEAMSSNGEEKYQIPIFKDPITDDGLKKSARGLLQVYKNEQGEIELKQNCTWEEEDDGLLRVIYRNGQAFNKQDFNDIRNRLFNN